MIKKPRELGIVVSPAAQRDLEKIWDWNHQQYSRQHAEKYIQFLDKHITQLKSDYGFGRRVLVHSEFRYIVARKGRGNGHVIIYKIHADFVEILRLYHTSQNWQNHVVED